MKSELWAEVGVGMYPEVTEMLEKYFDKELGLLTGNEVKKFVLEHEQEIRSILTGIKLYYFQGVKMEEICPVCNGDPDNSPDKNSRGRCNKCLWRGKILTSEGKNLVDFLTNYLPFSQ